MFPCFKRFQASVDEVRVLRRELEEMARKAHALADFDKQLKGQVVDIKQSMQHHREHSRRQNELTQRQLENELLKFERHLPPKSE